MKLPGSLKALAEQVEEIGYQICGELKYDADGHLVGLPLRPVPPAPAPAAEQKQPGKAKGPRRSPTELFTGRPV